MLKKLGVEGIVLLAVVEDEDAGLRRDQRNSTEAGDETENLTNGGEDRESFFFVHRINLSEYGDENWSLA